MINAENISGSTRLNEVINDINLTPLSNTKKVNAYFEDAVALSFSKYLLQTYCSINLENFINFIDVNLGWTNYLQLYKKDIPEFKNSIINLDADVPSKREYRSDKDTVEMSKNILFLPLEIEKGLFVFLKDHANFLRFSSDYSTVPTMSYDICFRDWPLEVEEYKTNDFKKWYQYITELQGGSEVLFRCWLDSNEASGKQYAKHFVEIYNYLSDIFELDQIKPIE